jgi:hypothetical protein
MDSVSSPSVWNTADSCGRRQLMERRHSSPSLSLNGSSLVLSSGSELTAPSSQIRRPHSESRPVLLRFVSSRSTLESKQSEAWYFFCDPLNLSVHDVQERSTD